MTIDLLKAMKPVADKDKKILIGIKPNLVCPSKASQGATTHPEIVEGIIIYLKANGFDNIVVIESSWVGSDTEDAADYCGYTALCKKYNIPFINVKKHGSIEYKINETTYLVSDYIEKIDYMINVPLIKGHCQTDITCALKNMKGLIPDAEKRRYHQKGLHEPIAYLNTIIRQDLIIADAICPDPYFEEGGRPKQMDMIVGAYDPVLMDSFAAKVLGYNPMSIGYIKLANELGVGLHLDNDTEIIKIGEESEIVSIEKADKKYLNIINESDACSVCFSHLVKAMEQLNKENLTDKFSEQIYIGQGYKECQGQLGIGNCTSGFENYVRGCPPDTDDIIKFLKKVIKEGKA